MLALERCGFAVERCGSLGHRYRVGYVLDRLSYLHREGWTGRLATAGRGMLAPLRERSVFLNPGDVLILTARPTADGRQA